MENSITVGQSVIINSKSSKITEVLDNYVIITSFVGRNKNGVFYPYQFKVKNTDLTVMPWGYKVNGKKSPLKIN